MTPPNGESPYPDAPVGEPGAGPMLLALLQAHQRRGWRRGERPLVETYLELHPVMQADAETVLDLIYTEILAREEVGESPRLEEYLWRFPHLEPMLRRQFQLEQALGSAASTLGAMRLTPTGRGDQVTGPPGPVAIPGYEVLGELGRGGMGVVYKARHVRLNRTVALKMILAGDHASPEVAVGFLAEAEAVAQLHHPNIIQVFAFGTHEGRPYFEMEYAAGGSLAERLDGTPRPARDAARLVETLARAMHEVHRVGIVHRDLKPANVLLTNDDTPKVADFGLAKVMEDEARLTQTLRIVGSPSYMAPEQAGASSGPIGPAADVYALGAILYELLTGRPPFMAATVLETLEQVKSVEPVPPRVLRPDLPRDLATICLACLQKEPARRYAGADLLAEDLRRFGAGEAIRARPVSTAERTWRWCRREPALAGLAAALIAGLVVAATQWWRAERHLGEEKRQAALLQQSFLSEVDARRTSDQARASAQEARQRAQARFQLGLETVDRFAAAVGGGELSNDPRLGGLRKEMLGTALKFYTELQKSLEADPTPQARSQLAEAFVRVGQIHADMGAKRDALADFRRAEAIQEDLSTADPADHRLKDALVQTHVEIGIILRDLDLLDEAARPLVRGVAIAEALVRDHPRTVSYQEVLAWSLSNLGVVHDMGGRVDDAVRAHERALAIREALTRADPKTPRFRIGQAWRRMDLATALDSAGRTAEALRHMAMVVDVFEELVRHHPGDPDHRRALGWSLTNLGLMQRQTRDPLARRSLERSLAIREGLAREHPTSSDFQIELAKSTLFLAAVQAAAGQTDEALVNIKKAEHIAEQFPEVNKANILYNLACAYAQCGAGAGHAEGGLSAAEREAYADRAMAVMGQAIKAGFADRAILRRDIDLDSLRPRGDFQELMMDQSFPADPFQH